MHVSIIMCVYWRRICMYMHRRAYQYVYVPIGSVYVCMYVIMDGLVGCAYIIRYSKIRIVVTFSSMKN